MPDLIQLALYFAVALVLAVTPGPGIFYVAARTLAGGRAEGVASSFGTGLGGMVHVLAGSLGVSAVVLASAELFTALKLVGAAYLLWLGLRTFQSARRDALTALNRASAAPTRGSRRAFREGVLVEALNPKTAAYSWPSFRNSWSQRKAMWQCDSWCSAPCRLRSTPLPTSWSPLPRAAYGKGQQHVQP